MIRSLFVTALLAFSSTASAATVNLLRFGTLEGVVDPATGADEFRGAGFTDALVFDAGTVPYIANSPSLVGSLALDSAGCGNRGCARVLTIRFTVPAEYAGQPMFLSYSRYGGELDTLRYDGVSFANVSSLESTNMINTFYLGASTAGDHSLQFQVSTYMGGRHHYIDQIRLYTITP